MSANRESGCRGGKKAISITGQKLLSKFVAHSGLHNKLRPANDRSNIHRVSEPEIVFCQIASRTYVTMVS